jgi:hypothetical protein
MKPKGNPKESSGEDGGEGVKNKLLPLSFYPLVLLYQIKKLTTYGTPRLSGDTIPKSESAIVTIERLHILILFVLNS